MPLRRKQWSASNFLLYCSENFAVIADVTTVQVIYSLCRVFELLFQFLSLVSHFWALMAFLSSAAGSYFSVRAIFKCHFPVLVTWLIFQIQYAYVMYEINISDEI